MLTRIRLACLGLFGLALAGCSAPAPVELQHSFWQDYHQRVVVAKAKPITPGLYQNGQQGLLDIAISDASTNDFQNHLAKESFSWYGQFQSQLQHRLAKSGINARLAKRDVDLSNLVDSEQDTARHGKLDYRPFAVEFGPHKLLLIQVDSLGAVRDYYGFIPLDAPTAVCALSGRLIDLRTNVVLWRHYSSAKVDVSGVWDQAPHYPNFDQALSLAERRSEQDMFASLMQHQQHE